MFFGFLKIIFNLVFFIIFIFCYTDFTISNNTKNNKIYFGKTMISGCLKTKKQIILREIIYSEGEPWDQNKLERSLNNIRSLTIFKNVGLIPSYRISDDYKEDVHIQCLEDDPFEFSVRLGLSHVSSAFTHLPTTSYRVGGSFCYKNVSSVADTLNFNIDFTRFTRNISASYERPWLFETPTNSIFKAYSFQVGQPLTSGSNQRVYKEDHTGSGLALSRNFDLFKFNLLSDFEFMKLSTMCPSLNSILEFKESLIDRYIPYITVEPSMVFDNYYDTENQLGSLTYIMAKGVFPIGHKKAYFIKCVLEHTYICPLYKNRIFLATRLKLGHIFNSSFNTILPVQRFFLGGSNTIRGYEPNMVPPINSYNCDDEDFWLPIGSSSMILANAELRFNAHKYFAIVIFNDMGLLANNITKENIMSSIYQNFVGSTGSGVRVKTPFGPVRFDIGFKWFKRISTDKRYAFYLNFGQAF